ncbi:hypothetical protein [Streptomyces diastatochromogenes]|uniref:Uncharacterized protein n=1 Tax=Streptomyces diastatochromogenes TaxID=42236 RepID=A0A233SCS2_STRDA|nr:hypothetical protein [Streptomyces diastatochromogenes]MCZ0990357.1 hypothetical protein [Streptomyces diastatochromogenes]OXY93458.1 hypothetical protein BEK98_22375 [Streptomyces diastatochromogenes]
MPTHEPTRPADRDPGPLLDFRVDDNVDEQTSEAFYRLIGVNEDMLDPLAEHHSADNTRSFYVLFDRTATWDHPGVPQYVALYLQRDHQRRTFRFEQAPLPLPSMAQSWLIHRGCPPESIALDPERGTVPADEATRALEQRLMRDGDHYALGWSYTRDDPDDWVTLATLRALDERAPSPFRVVVEEVDIQAGTHTLREGGFETVQEALKWCEGRLSGTGKALPPVKPAPSHSRPASAPKPAPDCSPGRSR